MSHAASEWVWKHSRSSGTARLVMLAIADQADDEGGNAWPAVARIAKRCRVSERAVQRAIADLVAAGELSVELQAGGLPEMTKDRRPNRYSIPIHRFSRGDAGDTPLSNGGVTLVAERGDAGGQSGVTLASPKPSLNHPEPNKPLRARGGAIAEDREPDRFAAFWAAHPKPRAKLATRRAWDARVAAGADPGDLVAAAARYTTWVATGGVTSLRFAKPSDRWLVDGNDDDPLPVPDDLAKRRASDQAEQDYRRREAAALAEVEARNRAREG